MSGTATTGASVVRRGHAEPDRPAIHRPGIPCLMLSGSLDLFSPPVSTRAAAAGLGPQAHILEIPSGTHNVLGFSECAITARNDWAQHPTEPPGDACVGAPLTDFH